MYMSREDQAKQKVHTSMPGSGSYCCVNSLKFEGMPSHKHPFKRVKDTKVKHFRKSSKQSLTDSENLI